MRLLAIDPGNTTGWAVFEHRQLTAAGILEVQKTEFEKKEFGFYFKDKAFWPFFGLQSERENEVYIEIPRIYDRKNWKGDPNDLIKLALKAGYFSAIFPCAKIKFVYPQDWKGQTDKKIDNLRTLNTLSPQELAVLPSKDHNMLDAIGIGLWALGRK